jgi:hypothetical protein
MEYLQGLTGHHQPHGWPRITQEIEERYMQRNRRLGDWHARRFLCAPVEICGADIRRSSSRAISIACK